MVGLIRANGVVPQTAGSANRGRISTPVQFPSPRSPERPAELKKEVLYARLRILGEGSVEEPQIREAKNGKKTDNLAQLESAYAGRFCGRERSAEEFSVALDALINVVTNEFTPKESGKAADKLIRDHVRNEELRALLYRAWISAQPYVSRRRGEKGPVLENAPTREAQSRVCSKLAEHLRYKARTLRQFRVPYPDQFWLLLARASSTERCKTPAGGPGIHRNRGRVRSIPGWAEQYGDVTVGSETVKTAEIFKLHDLAIGKPAAKLKSRTSTQLNRSSVTTVGKVVTPKPTWKLDADRGCPRERTLVERSVKPAFHVEREHRFRQGNPFGVRQEWRDHLEVLVEPQENGLNRRRWRVDEIPSVFVIDAEGIIREDRRQSTRPGRRWAFRTRSKRKLPEMMAFSTIRWPSSWHASRLKERRGEVVGQSVNQVCTWPGRPDFRRTVWRSWQ